ncbi:MAG: sugar ABC transporter substrate-binding protein [Undibacterium sp.]|nr:sugar ABC transporter substrate-binding protein [Undibacterium sp.]
MTTFYRTSLFSVLFAFGLSSAVLAQQNVMQYVSAANAKVAKAAALKSKWDGPTSGPKLQKDKRIIFIAQDMSDAGISGLFAGMKEALAGTNWQLLPLNCNGNCNISGDQVVKQALGMKATGIVLAGVDAASQAKGLALAAAAHVPVVGWHASIKPGSVTGLFTNVMTEPKEAAQIAGLFGVVEANSKAGIVVFTDSSTPFLAAKSAAIVDTLKQCQSCNILSVESLPLPESRKKFPTVIEGLVKKNGVKWTHVIAVNDVYFDMMDNPEIEKILQGTKLRGISAGDGSTSAYKRIHKQDLQIASVPEPLFLHGWQLVDELNRAMSNLTPSTYIAPLHLVTSQNVSYDGGTKDVYDPSNDFRAKYLSYWGK